MRTPWTGILLVVFLWNCSGGTLHGPNTASDMQVLDALVGTWSAGHYTITFSSNHTFTDTVYTVDDSSQHGMPKYARSGTYDVQDSILYLQNIDWTYFVRTRGISIILRPTQIRIRDGLLEKRPVEVFENVEGSGDTLWGTWTQIKWTYYQYHWGDRPAVYEGRQEVYYEFSADSSQCTYGWNYIDGYQAKPPEFQTEFSYTPPYLDIVGPAYYDVKVVYKYGKMYWYLDYPVSVLERS